MEFILSIIFIVFGVLQIILFFKLWGMTGDVKELLAEFKSRQNRELQLPRQVKIKSSDKEATAITVGNGKIICNVESGGVEYSDEFDFEDLELL